MNNATIIMNGLIKIVIVLCVAGVFIRLLEMADKYFNRKDEDQ